MTDYRPFLGSELERNLILEDWLRSAKPEERTRFNLVRVGGLAHYFRRNLWRHVLRVEESPEGFEDGYTFQSLSQARPRDLHNVRLEVYGKSLDHFLHQESGFREDATYRKIEDREEAIFILVPTETYYTAKREWSVARPSFRERGFPIRWETWRHPFPKGKEVFWFSEPLGKVEWAARLAGKKTKEGLTSWAFQGLLRRRGDWTAGHWCHLHDLFTALSKGDE